MVSVYVTEEVLALFERIAEATPEMYVEIAHKIQGIRQSDFQNDRLRPLLGSLIAVINDEYDVYSGKVQEHGMLQSTINLRNGDGVVVISFVMPPRALAHYDKMSMANSAVSALCIQQLSVTIL